jgi:protein-L-isoaspartate(D-aspartate) O-methyltransferase
MGFARLSLVALISCAPAPPSDDAAYLRARERMVAEQIEGRDVKDPLTLAAMRKVPRHLFVAAGSEAEAYDDHPLPIGHGQTISQPYVVGFMTQAMGLHGGETVLEIGTGSGYQAAVLSEIAARVYTIEIVAPLAAEAEARLKRLGYAHVSVRAGDGYAGWPEKAPFDAIVVTAAAPRIPEPLKEQLKEGGRLVVPVGDESQEIVVLTKRGASFEERRILPVRFVPMTGTVRKKPGEP